MNFRILMNRISPYLLAFALGSLLVLSFAPFYQFYMAFIALAGISTLWQRAHTLGQVVALGFCFGLGLYIAGIYWIYISLHDFGGMPWWFAGFCTFCLCAFMAIFPALVGYFSKKSGAFLISIPIFWGLSDWVRGWIFTGFPWLTLGYSQVPFSPLAGFVPVLGVYGASVLTAFVGVVLAQFLSKKSSYQPLLVSLISVLVLGLGLKQVAWTQAIGQPIQVSLLQGNIAQHLKWSPDAALSTIHQYLAMLEQSQAQLVVMPETALPLMYHTLPPEISQRILQQAQHKSVVIGMIEHNQKTDAYYNSAFYFHQNQIKVYQKQHLVPFGEFIPLKSLLGWIYRDWLNMPLSDISRGAPHQNTFPVAGQKIGMNICYEDVFGEEIAQSVGDATILLNLSNDAWYGQSIAADQHLQFSQARALETGRTMLRATNTGATASIDPQGYLLAHAPHDTTLTLNVNAQGFIGRTPYLIWGNDVVIVLCALCLLYLRRHKP